MNNKTRTGELNGFLDHGSSFKGELEFEDTMRIDGKFNGTIIGKIIATQRVEIHRNGKVYSDIDTPALIIEEGAIFQGNCVMGDKKSANVTNIAAKA